MDRPVMILHGTVDSSLDDCMLETFASTDEAWKAELSRQRPP